MLPDGSSARGVPASAQGPASGQGQSTFLIGFGVNEPMLTVWDILEYYCEERGRSISSAESHRLSHQNLSTLQLLSIMAVWVGLISSQAVIQHHRPHITSPEPFSQESLC